MESLVSNNRKDLFWSEMVHRCPTNKANYIDKCFARLVYSPVLLLALSKFQDIEIVFEIIIL